MNILYLFRQQNRDREESQLKSYPKPYEIPQISKTNIKRSHKVNVWLKKVKLFV